MITNENYYNYDGGNVAKTLQKAMSNNADASVVKYLNDVRKKKIKDGGESMAMYEDDNLTRAADEYVQSFEKTNLEKLSEARREAQKNSLQRAYENIYNTYSDAEQSIEKSGAEARRMIAAQGEKERFETEDALAKAGLGRGAYQKSTSGFSESARVKLASDAAEKIMQTYKDEQEQKMLAASQASEAVSAAEKEYMQNTDKAYAELEEGVLARDDEFQNRRIKLMELAAQNRQDERDFDYEKETNEYNRASEEKKAENEMSQREFDNAMSTFEMTGVITTQRQAQILGLPVGTKSEFMENLTYQKTKDAAELENEKAKTVFDQNYNMFKDVGVVTSEKQAQILGVDIGTKYWQYVEAMMRANAAQTSAGASYLSAKASQTNAAANYKDAVTNESNAQVKAEESRIKNLKVQEEIETSKQKRENQKKMYEY